MTGYIRQSTTEILPGEVVKAEPINRELNKLQDAFSGTTGHTHSGSSGDSPPINLAIGTTGILPQNRGGTGGTNPESSREALEAQKQDDILDSLSSLETSSNKGIYLSGVKTTSTYDLTSYGRALGSYSDEASFKAGVNLEIGVDVQAFNPQLTSLGSLSTNGIITRTDTNIISARTITGTSNQITVTNGNGVSGNPTISIPSGFIFPGGMIESSVIAPDTSNTSFLSAQANIVYLIATGNRTLSIGDVPLTGQKFIIMFTAVGSNRQLTLSSSSFAFPAGFFLTPTTSGTTDVIGAIYHSGIGKALVVSQVKNIA